MSEEKQICRDKSDREIVVKSLIDAKFFTCLYERYERRLTNYIVKISNSSISTANDILQESFIKAWINLNDFDKDLPFSSWIFRIVHNETISNMRKSKSYGKNNTVEIDEEVLTIIEDEEDQNIEQKYIVTKELIDQLSLKYREVLILKFYEKMSYEEISDVLKIAEGTVATRINRAKKQIKKHLQNNI